MFPRVFRLIFNRFYVWKICATQLDSIYCSLHRPCAINRYQQQVPNESGVGIGTFSGLQNQWVRHQIDANTEAILHMPNRCQHRTYYTCQIGANTESITHTKSMPIPNGNWQQMALKSTFEQSVLLDFRGVGLLKGGQNWPQICSTKLSFRDRGHFRGHIFAPNF